MDIDKVDLAIQEMTKDFLPQMERLEKEEKEIIAKEKETNSKLVGHFTQYFAFYLGSLIENSL